MKTQKSTLKRNIAAIGGLILVLVGVVYAMQYTRSLQFQSALEIFFNPEGSRTWSWCPEGTVSLAFIDNPETTLPDPDQACTLQIRSSREGQKYRPLLIAKSAKQSVVLEIGERQDEFRVMGLPFRSEELVQYFKTHDLKAE